jgi:hypothetical protein
VPGPVQSDREGPGEADSSRASRRRLEDAVSYEITQNDQERRRIYRRDLDDGAYEAIRTCFEMFS